MCMVLPKNHKGPSGDGSATAQALTTPIVILLNTMLLATCIRRDTRRTIEEEGSNLDCPLFAPENTRYLKDMYFRCYAKVIIGTVAQRSTQTYEIYVIIRV